MTRLVARALSDERTGGECIAALVAGQCSSTNEAERERATAGARMVARAIGRLTRGE